MWSTINFVNMFPAVWGLAGGWSILRNQWWLSKWIKRLHCPFFFMLLAILCGSVWDGSSLYSGTVVGIMTGQFLATSIQPQWLAYGGACSRRDHQHPPWLDRNSKKPKCLSKCLIESHVWEWRNPRISSVFPVTVWSMPVCQCDRIAREATQKKIWKWRTKKAETTIVHALFLEPTVPKLWTFWMFYLYESQIPLFFLKLLYNFLCFGCNILMFVTYHKANVHLTYFIMRMICIILDSFICSLGEVVHVKLILYPGGQ